MSNYRSALEQTAARADVATLPTPAEIRAAGDRRTRSGRVRIAAVAAAVAVLVAVSVSVVPKLGDRALQPTWRPVEGHGMVPADWTGVWVDSLPSGPVATAAWADGNVLHVGSRTVPITGRGIGASSWPSVLAATTNGWFARVGDRLGVIHPDGTFVEFPPYPTDTLLVSPDGSQALVAPCCDGHGGDLIDTATGRVVMHEPPGLGASVWTDDGIYANANLGEGSGKPVLWKPGVGVSRSPFDLSHCNHHGINTGPTIASLMAGYGGCTNPRLVSVSPDGKTALVGNDVVDVATGQKTEFAPQNPFEPYSVLASYAVLWEDNQHVLLDLNTPTTPVTSAPMGQRADGSTFSIVRCDVDTGSCERASDPFSGSRYSLPPPALAPLH